MKKKLILGSILAFAGITNAQTWGGSMSVTGDTYRTGNVGVGTTSPLSEIDVHTTAITGGVTITQDGPSSGSANLFLNNSYGRSWAVISTGPANNIGANHFAIYDVTAANPWDPQFMITGGTGLVGIGTYNPNAKLHVVGAQNGIIGTSSDLSTTGVYGSAAGTNASAGDATGISGNADGAAINTGGLFVARGAKKGTVAYGVNASVANAGQGGTNYGIYATVSGNSNSGMGPDWAGYFDGDVFTSSATYYSSDKRLKKNIKSMSNSLSIINKLNPVTYDFDSEAHQRMNLPTVKQYGFISQDVQAILPELTKTAIEPAKYDNKGNQTAPAAEILSLNYNGFIAILAKGIQEQQQTIDQQALVNADLQKQLDEQSQLIKALSQKVSGTTGINSAGGVENGFQLSQNEPNPFTHETLVKYTLPQSVNSAFMAVYDLTGKQITTLPITEKGSSSMTITSEKLSAGIYIYSIIADGKVVDSKRMIVAQN